MRAGLLRHRITIEQPTETRDSTYGGTERTWATYKTVWTRPVRIQGDERYDDDRKRAQARYRFECRHTPGVTPQMRVVWGARHFDIEGVDNVSDRDRETHILGEEVVA